MAEVKGSSTELYVHATAGATLTGADKVDGVVSFKVGDSTKVEETTNTKNMADGYMRDAIVQYSGSIDLEFHFVPGDAPQLLLSASRGADSLVYFTYYRTPSADAGAKGSRYAVKVRDLNETMTPSQLVKFDGKATLQAAPVAV